MFLVNVIAYLLLRKLSVSIDGANIEDAEPHEPQDISVPELDENTYTPEQHAILKRIGI